MAGPWEKYQQQPAQTGAKPWEKYTAGKRVADHEGMTAKAEAAIRDARFPDQGMVDANLLSMAQGGLMNYGDEIFGGAEAIRALLSGEPVKPAYFKARDFARGTIEAGEQRYPKSTMASGIAGAVTTGVPLGIATGAQSLWPVVGVGAAEGAVSGFGGAKETDASAILPTAIGAGLGGAGAMAGYGVGKLIEKFTTRGLSVETIRKAVDGNTDELIAKMKSLGASAAETDEVLREVLRGQAAKNPTAAAAAVPAARDRLASVNAEVQQGVNDMISPDNARLLIDRLKKEAQDFAAGKYGAAYATEGRVGLVPELADNPGLKPAIEAAKELAGMEGHPFDVTALSVKDLDAMQRALRGEVDQLFKEGGTKTIFGPAKSEFRETINDLAKAMSQDFADVQRRYAENAAQREAVKLGQQALNPAKEFVEVAEEFARLSPLEQEAYKAAVATRARTLLQSKQPTANAALALRPEAIIEKLKAVGFPEEQLNALIQKGMGARGVLDALQGGSDTARKLAAAAASESPMTAVKPQDLMTGALVHPATLGLLPALRSAGTAQERRVAEMLIRALTTQSPDYLQRLFATAPQRATPALGMFGGAAASQTGLQQ